ncbi:Rz1-like lysis system protein LysC [Buttiauxella ferragutiae]|uniref:Rz1-like lysis system protein LysC n=1 Tax=Buttiauxella ferragutiae TaxID=82989 RepID=UPI001F53853E|nr:Rz1-like lysis system protein LysC [Buttiauxella ferragutiae]UNK60786.1 Rz1-like lysis system protein LysC [Buttiauxella ferragutiae]
MTLSGCTLAPHSPPPLIIYSGCPKVALCKIPASQPHTNGDLSADIRQLEAGLVSCAAQTETIRHCQEKLDAQARQFTQSPL